MTIRFQPQFGQILICDFPKEFKPPEMVKRRPVVCISPKARNRHGVATVVPLSTTQPSKNSAFAVPIDLDQPICPAYPDLTCWAKCDMLYTLSYDRLSEPLLGKDNGKRIYNMVVLPSSVMCKILTGVLSGFGIRGCVHFGNDMYFSCAES